jgi:hypothetical protein
LYDYYKENFNVYRSYFRWDEENYEKNKIICCFELYIQVYKEFINLYQRKYLYKNSVVDADMERPKYGVYIS